VVCLWTGLRSKRRTLLWQASAYLAAAFLAGGAIAQAGFYLLRQPAMLPGPEGSVIIATMGAAIGSAILLLGSAGEETIARRTAWVLFVGLAGWNGTGMLAWLLSTAIAGFAARGPLSATLATVLLCSLALTVAWIGRRRVRSELVWLVPPLLMLTAYKLLAEDLRHGQTWTMVVSLLAFGAVLLMLPRLLQKRCSTS
jgi:hypothetical protein